MDINELQVRLLHAAKTKNQWKVVTSYPKKGEVCLEAITSTGATSFKIKIGDGTRPYCRNTGTPESPVWDFTSDQVLPYFGTTVVTDGTVSVVSIGTYTEGASIKKKLVFYPLSLASSTVEGVTTLSPVLGTNPYLEIREGTGIEFTVDETGTPKLLNINISSSYLNDTITSAINALDTPSPLNLAEWDSSTNTLSLYSLSETNGIVSKSSTAIATIDLSGIAPVQDVQVNSTSILSNGVADIAVDGTYDSSTNKIATESTVSNAVADLDVAGYGQATIDTTTSNQTTLTVKGIKEDDGKIAADSTQDVNIVMDGTYNASYNKVATQTTVSNAIVALDGTPTTVDATSSTDVITTVSETNGVVSSTKKTIVEGNKIDINVPTTGTSTGDIIISHEDIDTTAADVSSTITTDGSSVISEKELDVITGLKVDAQGHITHIDKDKSTNLVAADIKGSVSVTDDSAWIYRPTGGTISIGEDIAKVNGLEGNSVVWNQLVQNGDFSSGTTGWSASGGTIAVQNKTLTYTSGSNKSIFIYHPLSCTSSHKYLIAVDVLCSITYSLRWGLDATTYNEQIIANTWKRCKRIVSGANGYYLIYTSIHELEEGTTIQYKNAICIDLTLLGIDNLITVAQVEAWLAQHVGTKPYYAYNTGEILSAKTLGFNTYGQNLLNPTTKQARLVTYTDDTNSNKYTIKNIPDETTVTYTPDNTGISVDVTSLIENDTFDVTSYGNGILELSAVADNTYICIKWDGTKDDDIVPYEEHNYNFDVTKVYGRVNGAGEYVQCFPDGMKSAGSVYDILTANEAVVKIYSVDLGRISYTMISDRAYNFISNLSTLKDNGEMICTGLNTTKSMIVDSTPDNTVSSSPTSNNHRLHFKATTYASSEYFKFAMNGVMLYYELDTPITYTDLIYSEDGGQTGTPLKKVLLTMNVNDFGTEEQVLPDYVDDNPTSIPANVVIEYKSNFKEAVLETIDKVSSYKNPVRGINDTPQTTDKLAVYDSDSTVKSSTYEISNSTIDPEGTSNNTIVPTANAVVDYVEDVVSTEVTVKDITTTDDDTSGNGGIRVTNSGTTYDVHHADITQTDTTKQSTGEVVANVVTNVTVDSFGHVKGKEVISSDKLVAADIKAPVKQTDNSMWNHRVTGGTINIGEDTAKINPIKGNTIVWNQMIQNGDFNGNIEHWSPYNSNNVSVVYGNRSIIATLNSSGYGVSFGVRQLLSASVANHKYFVKYKVKPSVDTTFGNEYANINTNIATCPANVFTTVKGFIISVSSNNTSFIIKPTSKFNTGDTYEIKDVIFIDLTKMFGAGNEPTTAEEFEAMFPNSYYPYNEGELLSLNPDGVKSVGFNQWDEKWRIGILNGNGYIQAGDRVCSTNLIPVIEGETYHFRVGSTDSSVGRYETYDRSRTLLQYIGNSTSTLTIPEGVAYIRFCTNSNYGTTYNHDICINLSDPSRNGTYEPYKETTLDLSWIKSIKDNEDNQLFPNGLLSAGNVYDEVGEDYAVKRVGVVDLGSLTWNYYSQSTYPNIFIASLNGIKQISSGAVGNLKNILYTVAPAFGGGMINKTIRQESAANNILICDETYTDKDVFKTAMSGVLLYYELATPITVTFDRKSLSYIVDDLGTETLLPEGIGGTTATPLSAPFNGQFEYKSNFKDTVLDLVERVNNARNPVKSVTNTNQTVDKLAIYDSVETVKSSNYSPSNATIVEGATGNNIILPAVETVVNYVNSKLSSALTYKGTVTQWSDLPTSGQNTGDMYIASTTFTEQGVTYNAGDFFIWNGSSWDIVSGTTSVDDKDISLVMNGTKVTVATVDGNDIHITPPNLNVNSPSSSSTEVDFIDTVSQTNGLISATKKRVRSASTSQDGIVTLSSGIESTSSEDSKVPTAYDTLTNLNNRDVDSGTIINDIATLSKRMLDEDSTSPTYESWINKTFYPTTKFNAINDFSTAFGTNYPDLNTIEGLSTTGFLKRTGNNTWELTDDTGKMKWLDEVTNTYTYSAVSTNLEELGSYIHNYYGITSIEKAVLDNNNYGFRIDVPILSSNTATIGKVLKGTKTTGITTLPIWEQLGIEELSELDNLGSNTGYLKRKAGATTGTYEWELSTPASTTVATTKNDGTETTPSSTVIPGIKVTTNGTTTYHKVPFSAISNDDSTGANAVTIILNGNFN